MQPLEVIEALNDAEAERHSGVPVDQYEAAAILSQVRVLVLSINSASSAGLRRAEQMLKKESGDLFELFEAGTKVDGKHGALPFLRDSSLVEKVRSRVAQQVYMEENP